MTFKTRFNWLILLCVKRIPNDRIICILSQLIFFIFLRSAAFNILRDFCYKSDE